MATRKLKAKAAGGVWTTAGTWEDEETKAAALTAPTAEDDCKLDKTSGAVTISSASKCRSFDWSEYEAILKQSGKLTVGAPSGVSQKADKYLLKVGASVKWKVEAGGELVFSSVKSEAEEKVGIVAGFYSKGTENLLPAVKIGINGGTAIKLEEAGLRMSATSSLTLEKGKLQLKGSTNEWGKFFCAEGALVRELVAGAANIKITGTGTIATTPAWYVTNTGGGITMSLTESTIEVTDASETEKEFYHKCGSVESSALGNLVFSGNAIKSNLESGSIAVASFTASGDKVYVGAITAATLNINTAGKTTGMGISGSNPALTFTNLTTNGSAGNLAILAPAPTAEGTVRLKKATGTVPLDYIKLKGITGEGGALFRANFSEDLGSNVNISFEEPRSYGMIL